MTQLQTVDNSLVLKMPFASARLPQVDWLRALAALGVFFFHVSALAGFPKRVLPEFALWGRHFARVPSIFSLGASGVNLFFVLSGFCLALQQWRRGAKTLSGRGLRAYARNRVARIVPAYWAAILVSAAVVVWLTGAAFRQIVGTVALHLLFLHGFDPHSFLTLNGALWSMAIEVQFYVFFPVLLRLYEKHGGVRFLALVGAATVGYRLIVALLPLPSQPIGGIELGSLLMYQMPGRVLEFALGMWLADLYLHNPNQWNATFAWIWIPILPVALWCRAAGPAFLADPMLGILYCAITGFAVICLGVQTGGVTSLLEQRAAAFGRASYSFFLIHLPVLEILMRYWPADNEHPYATFLRLSLVGFAFSAAAGALLYHTVELPLWDRYRAPAVEHPRPRSLTPVTVGVMAPTAAEQRS
ncbi:MAG TPA: acyltransferase [Terriglobia bacterium]|jgi:peptidoglycan/LPS O-acetylase OafA/YrhL|nr:acyltransferase [Terriglobia bacterium]